MSKTKSNRILIIAVSVLLLFLIVFTSLYFFMKPKTSKGGKNIVIAVTLLDMSAKEYPVSTDAEFLAGALAESKLVPESDLAMGFVTTIDGITADSALEQWWMMTVNGEFSDYGINDLPIEDGSRYEFTLTEGWDW